MTWIILHMIYQIMQVAIKKRSDCKGGGVPNSIHNSLNFKTRYDLSTNCGDIDSLILEIIC